MGRLALSFILVAAMFATAHADSSKLAKEATPAPRKGWSAAKTKLCCGYPLSEKRGFRSTFY